MAGIEMLYFMKNPWHYELRYFRHMYIISHSAYLVPYIKNSKQDIINLFWGVADESERMKQAVQLNRIK